MCVCAGDQARVHWSRGAPAGLHQHPQRSAARECLCGDGGPGGLAAGTKNLYYALWPEFFRCKLLYFRSLCTESNQSIILSS